MPTTTPANYVAMHGMQTSASFPTQPSIPAIGSAEATRVTIVPTHVAASPYFPTDNGALNQTFAAQFGRNFAPRTVLVERRLAVTFGSNERTASPEALGLGSNLAASLSAMELLIGASAPGLGSLGEGLDQCDSI